MREYLAHEIIEMSAEQFKVNASVMCTKSRNKDCANARIVAYILLQRYCKLSLYRIGDIFDRTENLLRVNLNRYKTSLTIRRAVIQVEIKMGIINTIKTKTI